MKTHYLSLALLCLAAGMLGSCQTDPIVPDEPEQKDEVAVTFSVSDTKQVLFSKGNLYATKTGSDWKFGFYENQFKINSLNSSDSRTAAASDNEIDLFTWGNGQWSTDPATSESLTGDAPVLSPSQDWGVLINDGEAWRTLTNDEWIYILKTRNGAGSKCKYGVNVCGMANCVVLAPDSWTETIAESYDAASWAAAEQKGLVCLPAAGMRNGAEITGVGESGHYWTATAAGETTAFSVAFNNEGITTQAPASSSVAQSVERKAKTLKAKGENNIFAGDKNADSGSNEPAIAKKSVTFSSINALPDLKEEKHTAIASNVMQQSHANQTVTVMEPKADDGKTVVKREAAPKKGISVSSASSRVSNASPKSEPVVILISGEPSISTAGDTQAITVVGNDNLIYAWGIKAGALEAGVTYTFDQMDPNYTYRCSQDYFSTWEDPTDATFSIDAENNITASMVTESGTYMVYTNAPQTGYETVNVVAVSCSIGDYGTDMMYTLSDANGDIYQFDIYYEGSIELGHTYTYDDMDKTYTCYATNGRGYGFETAEFTLTENEKGLKHIAATVTVPAFEKQFNITWDQEEPKSFDVVAEDCRMTDYGTDMYFMLTDDETGDLFYFDVYYDGFFEYGTTYTLEDMDTDYSWLKHSNGPGSAYSSASITVSLNSNGLLHIVAQAVTTDGNTYNITFDEKSFEPSGNKITVNGTALYSAYQAYYGFFLYTAKWGDYTVQLAFDTTEEKATYTNDDFIPDYGLIYSDDEEIALVKLASDITITTTETTKTLSGSVYAKNGDEYILNLVYEKPAAKEISINVKDATLTNKTVAGFWKLDGQTADKNNSFSIYFISKALQGTFTNADKFDTYNTWVSDKSSGSNVYYENLSAVNLTSAVVGDSLVVEGTMALASSAGEPANVTVHISTPFEQTWSDWEDFAPFDVNTGKYTYTVLFNSPATQSNVPVQVRKDNTGYKQFKFIGWGKGILTSNGIDLLVNMTPDYTCTVPEQNTGAYQSDYSEYVMVQDYGSKTGQAVPSSYDPETGVFELAMTYYISLGTFGSSYEAMVMDKPITQRDTVKVTSKMGVYDYPSYGIVLLQGEDENASYSIEVVGSNYVGTFSYADGTLSKDYFWCIVLKDGSAKLDFAEGEITVTEENGGYHLTGLMIGDDDKAYVLDWFNNPDELAYDTDAPFDAEFAYSDMSASMEDGVIGIYATNAEGLTIGLELYTDPEATEIPEGTYVIADTQEVGTALKSVGVVGGYLTECWAGTRSTNGIENCWFIVDGTVTLSYDEYDKLKVVVDGTNSCKQSITATVSYTRIDPESTITIENGAISLIDDYIEDYGIVYIMVESGNYLIDLYAYGDNFFGDLTDVVDYRDCGIYAGEDVLDVLDVWELNVEQAGKTLTLTAKIIGSDNNLYDINVTNYEGAIEGDAQIAYEGTFTNEEVALTASGTQVKISGTNAEGDQIALVLTGRLNKVGALSSGEYTEIEASIGLDEDGQVTPSAVVDADSNAWFIQGGKLVVAEDGSMTFTGANSYDKTVTVSFTVKEEPEPVDPLTRGYGYSVRLVKDAE